MNIAKRVGALEDKDCSTKWENYHSLIAREGQSEDEAIDEYGRDKIGPRDFVVIRKFVSPRFDADGKMIFWKDWPENQQASLVAESQASGRLSA